MDVKQREALFLESENSQDGGKIGPNQVERVLLLLPLGSASRTYLLGKHFHLLCTFQ